MNCLRNLAEGESKFSEKYVVSACGIILSLGQDLLSNNLRLNNSMVNS